MRLMPAHPPHHRKYNPIEWCWGILKLHWNGAKLVDPMLAWEKSMTVKDSAKTIHLKVGALNPYTSVKVRSIAHIYH